ncbi:MAG: S8 family serine peptidase, partial [Planctomycetes bacterium]|nr:S8 family serine peptidase [Planctomycetota bacterium]
DGVEMAHEDLVANANNALSRDFNDQDNDPSPVLIDDAHGTAVAGIIAARADNNLGVSGGAHMAQIAGLRLLGNQQTSATEAQALAFVKDFIDIYNNSWGPPDDGGYHPSAALPIAAIQSGVNEGRNGRGCIYVWAGGNGGNGDWSNLDGFANMPETIAVGALSRTGVKASYSERGANIFCVAPGGNVDVVTTDRTGADGYNAGGILPNPNYTSDFDGTSAATPMVSAVVALMLHANPTLNWREVQHILARTCVKVDANDAGWHTNAGGLDVHHGYGFGLVDGRAASALATQWKPIGPRERETSVIDVANTPIPNNSATGLTRTITVSPEIYLEHVELELTLNHGDWGHLVVTLTSPDGTVAQLADANFGGGPSGNTYTFTSVQHWGEKSNGTWTLKVADIVAGSSGSLVSWRMHFSGTVERVSDTGGTPPTANSIDLSSAAPGETITIAGANLSNAEVSIGGVAATVLSNTPLEVKARVANGTPAGLQTVLISTPSGTAILMLTVDSPPPGASLEGGGGGGGCSLTKTREAFALVLALFCLLTLALRQRRQMRRESRP